MVISRTGFYGILVGASIALCGLYQAVWLFSRVTTGEIRGFGRGAGRRYRSVQNTTIAYSDGIQAYTENYLRNGISDTATTLEIRYLMFWPAVSRENTWTGNWGGPLLFFIITFTIISIAFMQDSVIPSSASFQLRKTFPFIRKLDDNP